MNIAVVGSGYVGLVTGACFSELGNNVVCVDNNAAKIASLKKGVIPIFEPGLKEMVAKNVKRRRLFFSTSIKDAVKRCEVIFIAVENVARAIAENMDGYRLVVEKSTVPVQTGEWVKHTIRTYVKKKISFDVASNPEFLREGSAVEDFFSPRPGQSAVPIPFINRSTSGSAMDTRS